MNKAAIKINELNSKISKLENDFKSGVPTYHGFTIDLHYEGNKHIDLPSISIGAIDHGKNTGKEFYDFILEHLKQSLEFWKEIAKTEIRELEESLK